MLAYSSISQGGFILDAARGRRRPATPPSRRCKAVVIYLLIYAAMNLGAFAVVIAVRRKTRSGEISLVRRAVQLRARAWPC